MDFTTWPIRRAEGDDDSQWCPQWHPPTPQRRLRRLLRLHALALCILDVGLMSTRPSSKVALLKPSLKIEKLGWKLGKFQHASFKSIGHFRSKFWDWITKSCNCFKHEQLIQTLFNNISNLFFFYVVKLYMFELNIYKISYKSGTCFKFKIVWNKVNYKPPQSFLF